jgi:hypothetical protein
VKLSYLSELWGALLGMYYDTGLFNEDIIIENYTNNNKEFIRELDAEIDSRLSSGL